MNNRFRAVLRPWHLSLVIIINKLILNKFLQGFICRVANALISAVDVGEPLRIVVVPKSATETILLSSNLSGEQKFLNP